MSTATAGESVETWSGKTRHDENFPVGVLIRPALRRHVHAFYRFARNADDIADSASLAPDDKLFRLDVMQDVLLGTRDHGAPSAMALRDSLRATNTAARHATDLLIAFRRDATQQRTATWDALMDYCRYSAMPVGRHVLDLHGEDPARTHAASDALCASLQILIHLQDCARDLAELDRCYLPQDLLAQTGAAVEDLRLPAETSALRMVFNTMLDRVDALNAAAPDLPRGTSDRRLRLETSIIASLARRLARRLRRADPVAGRVKLRKADAAFSLLASVRWLV